jgi:uncharacterized membrane protein YgcG
VAYSRIRPGAPGTYVRRKDSAGRTYHLDRETGKRVSRDVWQHERATIAFDRAVEHAQREERHAVERFQAPFPEGVGPTGVPTRKRRKKGRGRGEEGGGEEGGGEGGGGDGDGGGGGGAPRRAMSDDEGGAGDWFDDLIDDGFEPFAVEGEDDT